MGPLPLSAGQLPSNGSADASAAAKADGEAGAGAGGSGGATTVTKNVVLSDGTYATQTTVIGESQGVFSGGRGVLSGVGGR